MPYLYYISNYNNDYYAIQFLQYSIALINYDFP